jgi:hypothetical protein
MDRLDEERFLQVARDDGRSFVAALIGAVHRIQDESSLRGILGGGVALIAAIDEDRAHVLLEELEAFRGRRHSLGGRSGRKGREGCESEGGESERQHGLVS